MEAYCLKCKKKVEIEEKVSETKTGGKIARGICPECGGKITKFVAKDTPTKAPKVVAKPETKTSLFQRLWAYLFVREKKPKLAKAFVYCEGNRTIERLERGKIKGAKPRKYHGVVYFMEMIGETLRPFVPRPVTDLSQNISPEDLYGAREWEHQASRLRIIPELWNKLASGSFVILVVVMIIAIFMLTLIMIG